jgi:hypothetical protein
MKIKLCLCLSAVLWYTVSMSQPVLTSGGINPVVGESYSHTVGSYASPGSAGASQSWDISSITGSSSGLVSVVAPASTINGASFPGSNVAYSYSSGSVIYLKTSASALQNYGAYSNSVVMPYSNPEDLLRFPVHYNDTYVDPFSTQFVNSGYTYYRSGTATVTADAWGTLTTPAGTYTNVMRVHLVEAYQDSADFGGPFIITYNNDEYLWYKEGTHIQLAWVYTITNSISGSTSVGAYMEAGSGVEALEVLTGANISPNPARNMINIDFSLSQEQDAIIRVYNAVGQEVKASQTIDGQAGENSVQLDVGDLPQGCYYAQLMLNGKLLAPQRFVVVK